MRTYISPDSYINRNPDRSLTRLDELRQAMQRTRVDGSRFLDYLLDGDFFEGKAIWISDNPSTAEAYKEIIGHNPHLEAESPFGPFFDRRKTRLRGENEILLSRIEDAPADYQQAHRDYLDRLASGHAPTRALFAGGPAAKIAAIMVQMQPAYARSLDVRFLYDGGEQSNESASAHYEHTNHANALNAEHDNSGLAILRLALRRAIFGERDPRVALDPDYHKVDLWPRGVHLRDLPLYLHNDLHGRIQRVKSWFGIMNDHDKSRLASRLSTYILSHIEHRLGISLRMPRDESRSFFFYLSDIEHLNSIREQKILARFTGIFPEKVSKQTIGRFYGDGALTNTVSADIFHENFCIRHGFDKLCTAALEELGGTAMPRTLIKELFFGALPAGNGAPRSIGAGVRAQDISTGREHFIPASYLGMSLGPTATYRFSRSANAWQRLCDGLLIGQPVPHQTIATGLTSQLLFKIVDPARFKILPHTGLKQTHFVEVGRWKEFLAIKLTSGGNIGLPVYSRSYALGALANMFRILTPDCGLEFVDVVCAWPGSRGINGPNNGQVVRLSDNTAVRFGEGGTGMSKMGSNGQIILDMIGLRHGLDATIAVDPALYRHTILDHRKITRTRLGPQ